MGKAALINSENIVVNIIVWDETCIAPEGTIAIVLSSDIPGPSIGWTWDGNNFVNPNPMEEIEPEPLTAQQKLEAAGLTIEELKGLLGL